MVTSASVFQRLALGRRLPLLALLLIASFPAWPMARPATPAPTLPAPSGSVVNVATEPQLQAAVSHIASNTTIVLAPGTYNLTATLYINGTFSNVGIRGGTANRDDVVLVGKGMTNSTVPFGIWTGGNVNGVTIANLTIRNVYQHPIIFNAGTQAPSVYNVRLVDAGEQFIKSNPNSSGVGAGSGDVAYSVFEYTTTAPSGYTNAIDIHGGANWTIRHNLFRNIVGPAGQLAGPAILAWNGSSNTITEGNTFLNCARGIAYGLGDVSGVGQSGGIIRNNFFYRSSSQPGDVAIQMEDSPNTQVLNNTVLMSGTYGSAIEYRFAGTKGVVIANNLLDGIVQARDGATGSVQNNFSGATAAMFVNPAAGDLHLKSTATSAIDKATTLANVADDWDGNARPTGAAPDLGADEAGATAVTYAISGHVRDASNVAASGVTMALGGARSATTTTDASGAFTFAALASGVDYTVTPSKTGFTFSPAGLTYGSLSSNQSSVDFMAAPVAVAPPTVSLTAPASGASVVAGSAVAVSASASAAADRTIASVKFYVGATLIGTDTTSPYGVTWTATTAGPYSVTATATDSGGSSSTSAARALTVTSPAPVTPVSGIWGASAMPGPLVSEANSVELGVKFRSDINGFITGVRFYKYAQNTGTHIGNLWTSTGTLLSSVTFTNEGASGWQVASFASPVAITANMTYIVSYHTNVGYYAATKSGLTTAVNNAQLHALADATASGNGAFVYGSKSAFPNQTYLASNYWVDVVFSTTAPPPPPPTTVTVALTAPTGGSSVVAPATIAIAANASTTSGTVSKVDFYSGATLIGSDTVSPFAFSWGNVAAGSYTLTAVATASDGSKATSAPVSVTVTPQAAPTVSVALTAPASGSSSVAPATIALAANASTTSGTVSKVEFFSGSTLIGTDTTSPYTFSWTNVAAGSYTLSAKVTTSGAATATSAIANVTVTPVVAPPPVSGGRVQPGNLVPIGTFTLPHSTLGTTWGFGSNAGCCAMGTYAVTYNPVRNSLFIGGHPYEQLVAEIAIPASFTGGQATALSNLVDPTEGKLNSINPSDPNSKVLSSALVYNGQLYLGAYAYYDGALTQTKSEFVRPLTLTTKGQVAGPYRIGSTYPGWVDRVASLIPAEWQAALGGPAFAGGGGGAINSVQSWGPSLSVFDPAKVGSVDPAPATLVLGYPIAHPLADTNVGNAFWSQADVVTAVVAIPGTSSVLFFGHHGMGKYCYGTGAECGDLTDDSKGTHAYPYRSQVWAYDMNDLVAVKNGQRNSYDVKPYAAWEFDASFKEIQGAAYDPATKHLFVSQVSGDSYNKQPLIRVYSIQ